MAKVRTGSIFELVGVNRLGVVESVIQIDGTRLVVMYPLSHAIFMASELDFIIMEEPCFDKKSMMAESWNSIAIPQKCLGKYVGRLSGKYNEYFSSFVYFKHQASRNEVLTILTGPPLKSNNDIRWLFRAQELEELSPLREQLVTTTDTEEGL